MRLVVDNTEYSTWRLRAFLQSSQTNVAVIPLETQLEALQSDDFQAIFKSAEILESYPEQASLLKNAGTLAGLSERTSGLSRRMIDSNATRGIREYLRNVRAARSGSHKHLLELKSWSREARLHLDNLDAENWIKAVIALAREFSEKDLKNVRTGKIVSTALIDKILGFLFDVSSRLIAMHPMSSGKLDPKLLHNKFAFRLAAYLLAHAMDRISIGAERNASEKITRNDLNDALIATCATYFDGLLSGDGKQLRLYSATKQLLDVIGHGLTSNLATSAVRSSPNS